MLEEGEGSEGGAGVETTPGSGMPAGLEEDGGRKKGVCCYAR